ncbi:integrin-linked protein kinase 1-like isoform X2 [Amaranthus tricolor]|uniref:integrin-linked protein kinase 1-like isoform X2 n=1 Tax=Amaranthus tricolor TaxID=29722 RepID=UPI00258A5609|nr:integrin-linked protein kinase 1-like isoform X2 [Amaranthus tricolor]
MEMAAQIKRGISRQFSAGSLRRSGRFSFRRQSSMDPQRNTKRFSFGRQSSLDPIRRSTVLEEPLTVPENLDSTMQLLFMACTGDVKGIEGLLNEGTDVNSIDLDGRTALHIAACEGHIEVVKSLLSRKANIDARDRWGSTAAADAQYYGNMEVYNVLKARGAKVPKTRKTPMVVANPKEVPEYELNPLELQVRRSDGIAKGVYQVAKWNGTKVAVKILDKESYSDPESINAFKYELTLLEKVRHPNIIQFVGAVTQNIPMMIVVEFHPKGDLGCYLQKKGRLKPSKSLKFALDIARGINCLHECRPDPVVHCDLKPKNILLDSSGLLKVAGFGLVRLSKISADKFKMADPGAGTRNASVYTAPELYNDEIFDKSVDAFSFAVILYEMIEGVHPFHPKPAEEAIQHMCLEGKRPPFKKLKSYPSELKELIELCWSGDPSLRPSFAEIILRLDGVVAHGSKQGWWKDTFKLPWL